ncbi:hypothetical protein GF373_03790, partial [bacterium]|nr:hypothetical protein [bacterium]
MKHILFLLPLQLTLALLQPPVQAQSPADMLGGGNIYMHRLEQAEDQLKLLRQLGCGMCRFPISPTDYRPDTNGDVPVERLDTLVLLAHRHGLEPMLLFEYYTKSHGEIGSYEDWFQTGQAFAQRFGPNSEWLKSQGIGQWGIRFYSAINEPMWKDNNPREIVVKNYVQAMEGLADGVHQVNPLLRVSPGGFQEIPLIEKNPYGPAIARLYNEGKLHAIDIHRYYDVQHQPMAGTYRNSLQNQFDRVKEAWGITTNIHFYTTEFNFKKRQITEEEAAKGFLTAIWD